MAPPPITLAEVEAGAAELREVLEAEGAVVRVELADGVMSLVVEHEARRYEHSERAVDRLSLHVWCAVLRRFAAVVRLRGLAALLDREASAA